MNTQNALTVVQPGDVHPLARFVETGNKDTVSRLSQYIEWQAQTGRRWHTPDLAAYRDYLLHTRELAPSTTEAYLGTVRANYRRVLDDNGTLQTLLDMTPVRMDGKELNLADRFAVRDEILRRMQNQLKPDAAPVETITVQDEEDTKHVRLTKDQAAALVSAPGQGTTKAIRDSAILALLLSTGIREGELCALDVDDLRCQYGGELALRIRKGKGCKQRMIPYGSMDWCLILVDAWLSHIGRDSGTVFCGLYRADESGRATPRPGRLTTRSVIRIVKSYPVSIDGKLTTIRPHDCRRTYAKLSYLQNPEIAPIQQNMGHSSSKTTLHYIGTLDASDRRTPALFSVDLSGVSAPRRLEGLN